MSVRSRIVRVGVAGAMVAATVAVGVASPLTSAQATGIVDVASIAGPAGSEAFGSEVLVLSNGNYVVTDPPHDEGGVADVGAVYLYDGLTDTVISKLTVSPRATRSVWAGTQAAPCTRSVTPMS